MEEYIYLKYLDKNDALRMCPLKEIHAECRNNHSKVWRDVTNWFLSIHSYNDLAPLWSEYSEWRIKK